MRRYTALAIDRMSRDPPAYGGSVLYRAVRLFVILGSDDQGTAHQFADDRLACLLSTLVSGAVFLLALTGAWTRVATGIRRGAACPERVDACGRRAVIAAGVALGLGVYCCLVGLAMAPLWSR